MKNSKLLVYGMVALAIAMSSCDKNSEGDVNYSPIPVEDHKANIENTGYDMFDEMKSMEQEPAMQANISLTTLVNQSDPFSASGATISSTQLEQTIAFAPVFASANFNETGMPGILKSMQYVPASDPETIQEAYDMLIGVYEWNFVNENWDYTQTGDKIVFLFPSDVDGTANNASYTVTYEGYAGVNPIPDYTGDLPQKVTASLKVDDVEISSLLAEVNYDSNGYPTLIEVTFTMGSFDWYMMASNTNNTAFSTEYRFKHGTDVLLRFTLGASGNWNEDNLDGDPQNIITGANASFQVMNLKMVGAINVQGFANAMMDIDNSYDWDTQYEDAVNAQVAAANQYIDLDLRYAYTDQVIAVVEAYLASQSETYGSYTMTDYWVGLRFVFSDGSKVDADTYFGDVLEDLMIDIEDYLAELENTYGL